MGSRLRSRYDLDDAQARLYVRLRQRLETAFGHGVEGLKGELESRVQAHFLAGFETGLTTQVKLQGKGSHTDIVNSGLEAIQAASKALEALKLA